MTPRHRRRIIRDRKIEEVRIEPGTPDVAEAVGDYSIEISFEVGNTLTFGTSATNKAQYGAKYLLFGDWDSGSGHLIYGGKKFWAVNGSRGVYLQVNPKELQFKKESRTVKGRKLR